MDNNLTVQEALTKLLAEKKSLLNDGKTLIATLQEHVAPVHSMTLSFFRKALLDTNIGEMLMLADKADEATRKKTEADSIARLTEINMPKERAVFIVKTLIEAMGWIYEPIELPPLLIPQEPSSHELKFIPIMGKKKRDETSSV